MGLTLTDAKLTILTTVADEPIHGYALAERLGVQGSTVYEHLGELEEHGYVETETDGRRVVYSVTEKGRLVAEAHS